MIGDCDWGIHDLSRIEVDPAGMPRVNMPMELGLHLGTRLLGERSHVRAMVPSTSAPKTKGGAEGSGEGSPRRRMTCAKVQTDRLDSDHLAFFGCDIGDILVHEYLWATGPVKSYGFHHSFPIG
jgi:hypothetical protein